MFQRIRSAVVSGTQSAVTTVRHYLVCVVHAVAFILARVREPSTYAYLLGGAVLIHSLTPPWDRVGFALCVIMAMFPDPPKLPGAVDG